jgi:hypothetical protein
MALPSLHQLARDAREPVEHDLRTVRLGAADLGVRVRLRRAEDGLWVGALVFRLQGSPDEQRTAEILRGTSEQQVWDSVRGLGAHHLRDLFRSLT